MADLIILFADNEMIVSLIPNNPIEWFEMNASFEAPAHMNDLGDVPAGADQVCDSASADDRP